MKPLIGAIRLLQAAVAVLFAAVLLLRRILLSTSVPDHVIRLFTTSPGVSLFIISATPALLYVVIFRYRKPRIYLLDYSCYKPGPDRKCTFEASERFVRRSGLFSPESESFMQNIYTKSGLGNETYGPAFVFEPDNCVDHRARHDAAMSEAHEGIKGAVDPLLSKNGISQDQIDVVVVTCGGFSPTPSLSSFVVNHYRMRDDVKTYNLSGMGCSSGVISIDLAAQLLLHQQRELRYALVIIIESISSNWYFGDSRSMLVTNCIFRVGCAAALITNDPRCRRSAKMELVHSLRTHHGSDDRAYRAAIQEEDEKGNTGIALTKDLILVAGSNLRDHIKILAPRVLPLKQIVIYVYSVVSTLALGTKPIVPDFTTAFDHFCIHTGGKAVIDQVRTVLRLSKEVTEPACMTLHRFGNTSCSLVFYELAYFEAKCRVRRGDRLWMIAFGTGFKVGSLVWKSLKDSCPEDDNPWIDCIDQYPVSW